MNDFSPEKSKNDFSPEKSKNDLPTEKSLNDLSPEVLEEIFIRVGQRDLVQSCSLVSQKWLKIIRSISFWKKFHNFWSEPEVKANLDKGFKNDLPWWFWAGLNPAKNFYERNLLKRTCVEFVTGKVSCFAKVFILVLPHTIEIKCTKVLNEGEPGKQHH